MRVCYFGIYDSEYSRNKILISGLRQNGVEVLECVSRKKGFSKYFDLVRKHWEIKNSYNVMIVGYPGFQAVILARFLTSKPIIFDAFVSLYDSMVLDRAEVNKNSLRALYFWCLDKVSMTFPEIVLFDTQEHIDFVSKEFNIQDDKFRRIFVGADTEVFYPREKYQNDKFTVLNYGHYVPLQGMEYIVQSAKILEENKDIVFKIIGDGSNKKRALDIANKINIKNVSFLGNLPLSGLAEEMSKADVCLGIFGNTPKTKRVIPNKVYEAVAMSKPVITADTPAIRELFDDSELFLVNIASAKSIADGILKVKANKIDAEKSAKKAYDKFISVASILKLGLELKEIIENL